MMNINDCSFEFKKLCNKCETISKREIFKMIGELDRKYSNDSFYLLNVNEFIIEIGERKTDVDIVNYAIKRLNKLLENNSLDVYKFQLGNALLSKFNIMYGENRTIETIMDSNEYKEAKRLFYNIKDEQLKLKAIINYGNTLDMTGRVYESIYFYDKALKISPNDIEAMGNKGIALYYLSHSTNNIDIMFQSKWNLEKYLSNDKFSDLTMETDTMYFQKYLHEIEKVIGKRTTYRSMDIGHNIIPDSDKQFFQQNNMYLNSCFNCTKCNNAFNDIVDFHFTLDLKKDESHPSIYPQHVTKAMKSLNEIIEDYSTSRFLFINALKKSDAKLDNDSTYFNTLDYCYKSIDYGKFKVVFKNLYNILDKIAHLVFYFYDIKTVDNNIYFKTLKSPEIKSLILEKNSFFLMALYNMCDDFEEGGVYNPLRKARNFMTHSYLDISEMLTNKNGFDEEKKSVSFDLFKEWIFILFEMTKSALLYFINELKKESRENETIKLPLPLQ